MHLSHAVPERKAIPTMDRETLLLALLFSVPPAIGLVGFFTILLGNGPVNPWGAAIGAVVAAAIFLLVLKASGGEPSEDVDGTGG